MGWQWTDVGNKNNRGRGKGNKGNAKTGDHPPGWGSYFWCPCGSWAYANKAGRCCHDCGRAWDKPGEQPRSAHHQPWVQQVPSSAAAAAEAPAKPAAPDYNSVSPEDWVHIAAYRSICERAGHNAAMPRTWTAKLTADEVEKSGGPSADQLFDAVKAAKSKAAAAKKKADRIAAALAKAREAYEAAQAENTAAAADLETAEKEFLAADAAYKQHGDGENQQRLHHPPPPPAGQPRGPQQDEAMPDPTEEDFADEEVRAAMATLRKQREEVAELLAAKRQRRQTDLAASGGGGGGEARFEAPPSSG